MSRYCKFYEDLYDFAPVGYLTLDEKMRIQGANLYGARLLNREQSSLVNIPLAIFISGREWEVFESCYMRLVAGETEVEGEVKISGTGSEEIDVILKCAFIAAESEKRTLLLALTDITDRKRIEEALLTAHDELENRVMERTAEVREKERMLIHQNRQAAMGELLENIAHQWRQPLNAIGLIVQSMSLMQQNGSLTSEVMTSMEEKSLELISQMSQTIDDFRNYFRPDMQKITFSVSEAIARTIQIIKDTFMNRMISLEIDADEDPVVTGYPNEFAQVILNLLVNAEDAFEKREYSGRKVIISIREKSDGCVVKISDNAGGIPVDVIDRIFDPYFTTKGANKGTGIGLYMSKVIIEKNMGGSLTARNIDGGAEFTIEV